MRFWILLFAIALMQLTCEAKPYKEKISPYLEQELRELLNKIPDDISNEELLNFFYNYLKKDVRSRKKSLKK